VVCRVMCAEQSKRLLTAAETVIAEILGPKEELAKAAKRPALRSGGGRNGSRRTEAFRTLASTGRRKKRCSTPCQEKPGRGFSHQSETSL
jgi:hypothetical protein